ANIIKLAITWAGNKERNEGVIIPKNTLVPVNDYAQQVLVNAFFKPFEKNEEFFCFTHDEDVSQNIVYQSVMQIFDNPDTLSEEASKLTRRLYEFSTQPKINGGEMFVALFDNVSLMDETVPAIGIFKIVNKDSFLKVEKSGESFAIQVGEGIGTGKLSMAALIFGVDESEGYRLMATDTISKKDTPSVFKALFLNSKPIEDNFFNTQEYIALTSAFIKEKAVPRFGLDRADAIDLMNRSAFYFKENEAFEVEDFSKTLFPEAEQQEAFKEFKEKYEADIETPLAEQFDISKQAVRKSSKVFKSVIKLDENFHIYVHGRRDLIERGFDEDKGKPYYKVFFDQEE
ncbi:MAG: nucleoid-associated protein, partial [Saprospiraceae bacterium]|nr:nucleoid-associated protein [Saprospiraceae bacterium]